MNIAQLAPPEPHIEELRHLNPCGYETALTPLKVNAPPHLVNYERVRLQSEC